MSDNVPGSKWTEEVQETQQEEGGGDFFGLVNIGWGFKFFMQGEEGEDLWFPYDKQDKTGASKNAALAKAKQAIVKYGITGKQVDKIETNFALWMRTSDIFGRDVSGWKTKSIFWTMKVWDKNMAETVIPHMEKLGISPYATQVWAKVSQTLDIDHYESKKKVLDRETGKEVEITVRKKVSYIAAVYPNEAACRAAAEQDSTPASTTVAEQSIEDEIKEVHGQDPTMTLYAIGQIYGKDAKELAGILGYDQPKLNEDVKTMKGQGVSEGEVAKFYGMAVAVVKRLWA